MLKINNETNKKMIVNKTNNALRENHLINMIDKINYRQEEDLLNRVLNNCSTKIIIEEPVEYTYPDLASTESSFEEAIRNCMRLSPETIMIGELRDKSKKMEPDSPVMTSVDQSETVKILCERFNI